MLPVKNTVKSEDHDACSLSVLSRIDLTIVQPRDNQQRGWRLRRTMIDKDRRASQRFKAKRGTRAFYAEGSWAIRDSSMDGVFVLDPEPLPVGTRIDLSLDIGTQNILLRGIVRRSAAMEGMAIQFLEMSPEARKRLQSQVTETTGVTLFRWLKNKRLEKLSRVLRTHAGVARAHDRQAFVFSLNDLAALLGRDSKRIDEVLEFMVHKGWAGKSDGADRWWIL
jgi:hypothetical protein